MSAPIPTWRRALRLSAAAVTLGSIAAMLYPDRIARPLLELGLAGQFAIGTIITGALAVEILFLVTGEAR